MRIDDERVRAADDAHRVRDGFAAEHRIEEPVQSEAAGRAEQFVVFGHECSRMTR